MKQIDQEEDLVHSRNIAIHQFLEDVGHKSKQNKLLFIKGAELVQELLELIKKVSFKMGELGDLFGSL